MNDVVIGATYRHYKGNLYRVLNLALLEATKEPAVVYECLYPNDAGQVWVRPLADFLALVEASDYRGPRFAREPGT